MEAARSGTRCGISPGWKTDNEVPAFNTLLISSATGGTASCSQTRTHHNKFS